MACGFPLMPCLIYGDVQPLKRLYDVRGDGHIGPQRGSQFVLAEKAMIYKGGHLNLADLALHRAHDDHVQGVGQLPQRRQGAHGLGPEVDGPDERPTYEALRRLHVVMALLLLLVGKHLLGLASGHGLGLPLGLGLVSDIHSYGRVPQDLRQLPDADVAQPVGRGVIQAQHLHKAVLHHLEAVARAPCEASARRLREALDHRPHHLVQQGRLVVLPGGLRLVLQRHGAEVPQEEEGQQPHRLRGRLRRPDTDALPDEQTAHPRERPHP
mmetsp:Transcript_124600/g.363821  ORF Transcript_124600/g.363821 Transcript_124600/m.363821 type:complete len:268 (+) Transcript_124600:775-1578(+)